VVRAVITVVVFGGIGYQLLDWVWGYWLLWNALGIEAFIADKLYEIQDVSGDAAAAVFCLII